MPVMNASVLVANALKMCVQTSPTHTASYQRLSNRTYLEMIATHRYSPPKTGGGYYAVELNSKSLHPQVNYTVAFSAGLNSL